LLATLGGLILVSAWIVGVVLSVPILSPLAVAFLWMAGLGAVGWLAWRAYQRLLWRVSGRLAFSYFLIGVVPIPLAALLLALVAWLMSGFFLGHLYRDALVGLKEEVAAAAAHGVTGTSGSSLGSGLDSANPEPGALTFAIARYRDGRRVAGDPRAPGSWPDWLAALEEPAMVRLADGTLTLAAASGDRDRAGTGGLAFLDQELGAVLRDRAGFWVEPRERDPASSTGTQLTFGEEGFTVGPTGLADPSAEAQAERREFFARRAESDGKLGFRDRPFVDWQETIDDPRPLADDAPAAPAAAAETTYGGMGLSASLRMLGDALFSANAELSQVVWVALLAVSLLLLAIYAVAELVALAMIFGLSRAVTRLYQATSSISRGDFSARIPVRRTDQLGALQSSFNSMAESLEDLVATSAQKELLDKELEIAREVQQSLIPQNLPRGAGLEFATLFEPSAAIGGDYFDLLRLSETELALVVADVSGHGLSTGLRMAMVKAAVQILVDEGHPPGEIMKRLDQTVRSGEGRFFVTATYARIDEREGRVDLVNAGHPPTYRVRRGRVEEILLPGSPLGGLGTNHGTRTLELEDGDLLVWLSDGLIEATDRDSVPFGYDRTVAALAGAADTAAELRDRLLAAIAEHTGGRPGDDDRTLVVMRYGGGRA
jgi:serine phosphatase RsbU (regulator of sigma subunit)